MRNNTYTDPKATMPKGPKTSLSPKELAEAIGVSESSVKRWVDGGMVEAKKTAGGHRRIEIGAALRLIRDQGHAVTTPSLLGLDDAFHLAHEQDGIENTFLDAIQNGEAERAMAIVVGLYTQGHSVARLCDWPIHAAFKLVRDDCPHPNEKCFVLHRARDICRQILAHLRRVAPALDPHAPLAAGGDVGYNIDCLPTHLAATALAAAGYRTADLADDVPVEILLGAIKKRKPSLIWISANGGDKAKPRKTHPIVEAVVEANKRQKAQIVLIGDAFTDRAARKWPRTAYAGSTAELAAMAGGLLQQA